MRTYKVKGRKFRAHNKNCADGFKEDRKSGAIYPHMHSAKTGKPIPGMNWEKASITYDFCAYCGKR